ncbi:3'(2'),5'-bisphosphate nucleotidase CysQ [Chitinophaga sp. CF418]|uniref:3'(2'),5'-bisphosphate nucleotidase CysQ n=1 Tax=Chitinophaga sp. CF418 TaxID=1855287 RepID=UPI00091BE14F|nr:3'(2'),5'-bisphosphate nucleotidase CysQ [Chitinophaga sp. CF418]SHN25097.1 3'(2'),5'-bisphosphate nucleotidase [Chitinophaga sp. CF418]
MKELLELAENAAIEAGKAVMDVYDSAGFHVEMKQGEMPVTTADRLSHDIITRCLKTTELPVLSEEGRDIAYQERKDWDYFWLIDPLDGTKEFIRKNGEFTINIALMLKNKPVAGAIYAPSRDLLYLGSEDTGVYKYEQGERVEFALSTQRRSMNDLLDMREITAIVSRSHLSPETNKFLGQFSNVTDTTMGSSLKFMLLLEGKADIYPRLGPTMEWDTAAAHAILNASGRGVYQMDLQSELDYNKRELTNPFFVAF